MSVLLEAELRPPPELGVMESLLREPATNSPMIISETPLLDDLAMLEAIVMPELVVGLEIHQATRRHAGVRQCETITVDALTAYTRSLSFN